MWWGFEGCGAEWGIEVGIGWFGWDRRVGSATRTFSVSAPSAFEGKKGGRETTQNSSKRALGVIPPAICMVVRTILNGQSDVIRQFKVTCSYSKFASTYLNSARSLWGIIGNGYGLQLISLMIVAINHPDATEQDRVRALKAMERVIFICTSEATLDKERIEISLDRSPTDWDETDEKLMQQFQHDFSAFVSDTRH